MDIQNLTQEDKVFIRTVFKEMRKNVEDYMKERDFQMTNPQLFTFLSFSAAALAVASDGTVDNQEIAMIEKIARGINVKQMVQIELEEMMAVAFQPEDTMTNEEFNLRVGSEILYLSKNMKTYEGKFLEAIKAMLTFDLNPQREGSLTNSFSQLMDSVVANNASKNKSEEMEKVKKLKESLGI